MSQIYLKRILYKIGKELRNDAAAGDMPQLGSLFVTIFKGRNTWGRLGELEKLLLYFFILYYQFINKTRKKKIYEGTVRKKYYDKNMVQKKSNESKQFCCT